MNDLNDRAGIGRNDEAQRPDGRRFFGLWRHLDLIHDGATFLRRRGFDLRRFGGVVVHHIDGPDPGMDLHDHPWSFVTIILRGGYIEEAAHTMVLKLAAEHGYGVDVTVRRWRRWSIHRMPLTVAHRIIHADQDTLTLMLRWRKVRTWGFYTPAGWVSWEDYDYATRRPCTVDSSHPEENMAAEP